MFSGSEETAVTSVSAGKPRSALEISTVRVKPTRMSRLVSSDSSAGSMTVTLTTKSSRPAVLKVITALPAAAPLIVNVALPLIAFAETAPLAASAVPVTTTSELLESASTTSLDSATWSEVTLRLMAALPVVRARVLPPCPLTTSAETKADTGATGSTPLALAGTASPEIPISATTEDAITRATNERRGARSVFSMRAEYESNVYLCAALDKD